MQQRQFQRAGFSIITPRSLQLGMPGAAEPLLKEPAHFQAALLFNNGLEIGAQRVAVPKPPVELLQAGPKILFPQMTAQHVQHPGAFLVGIGAQQTVQIPNRGVDHGGLGAPTGILDNSPTGLCHRLCQPPTAVTMLQV